MKWLTKSDRTKKRPSRRRPRQGERLPHRASASIAVPPLWGMECSTDITLSWLPVGRMLLCSGAFRQISLIKWIKVTEPTGAEMKGIHALHFLKLPSMAIFPYVFEHFISEMADEKRQNKKVSFHRRPGQGDVSRTLHAHGSVPPFRHNSCGKILSWVSFDEKRVWVSWIYFLVFYECLI